MSPIGRRLVAASIAAVAAAAPAQQPVEDLARFFEAVEVRVLDLDVVVVDRDGEPVTGLDAADFEVLGDGRALELVAFSAHDEVVSGATADTGATGADTAAPRVAEPVTWIVHFDQARLRTSRRNAIARELRDFLERNLAPGDRTLVATWDGDALRVVSRLSSDRQGALDAVAAIAETPVRASPLDGAARTIRHDINAVAPLSINVTADKEEQRRRDDLPVNDELRSGTRVAAENLLRQIEALGNLETSRARAAIGALRDLLALAAGLEGRVGVLLVGAGYDSNLVDNLYRMWESRFASLDPQARAGVLGASAHEVGEEYGRLIRWISGGRTTVFTIGAGESEGLDVVDEAGAGSALAGTSAGTGTSSEAAATLAGLADATGGRTFSAGPDLADRLGAARRHLATFYTLGVRPPVESPPSRFEVRVRREGLRALHRPRVGRPTGEDSAAAAAVTALLESGAATSAGLAIETGAPAAAPRGDSSVVPITIRVPLAELTLSADGAVHRGSLGYFLAVERPDGAFVRLEPRSLDFEVANDQLEASLGQSVGFRIDVAFGAGEHWIGVAVLDRGSGRRWSGSAPVEVTKSR